VGAETQKDRNGRVIVTNPSHHNRTVDNVLNDADLEKLSGLTRLSGLNLPASEVTDAGLVHLKDFASLSHLYLDGSKVTDAGLEHLKDLKELTV
jgi:hypothetical protein